MNNYIIWNVAYDEHIDYLFIIFGRKFTNIHSMCEKIWEKNAIEIMIIIVENIIH